ncbi:TPA: hypothetical protein EYP66_19655 [Candidatus Poribacteria bacterium]|nr:hypothetical protein [Candidatus Poribacteria bacterium]
MEANVEVTLRMRGNYPNISSGIVYLKNTKTGTFVRIQAPDALKTYGVSNIVMDSGASSTLFPEDFAEKLDVQRPAEGEEGYYIFSGVGGTCIGFVSLVEIIVGVENDESRLERPIYPFFLTKFAPSITSEGKLLSQEEYHPHTQKAVDFICPPFKYHDDYTLQVSSPNEEFVPLKRRLKLEVNVGLEMDYILIGRDWQKEFDILFKAEEITITGTW